jgi:predicted amidohydrolase YtcJ
MLRESLADSDQLLVHVSGYRGAKAILEAMDATGGPAIWRARRVRFEHGDGIFPDLFARVKEYGIVGCTRQRRVASAVHQYVAR